MPLRALAGPRAVVVDGTTVCPSVFQLPTVLESHSVGLDLDNGRMAAGDGLPP